MKTDSLIIPYFYRACLVLACAVVLSLSAMAGDRQMGPEEIRRAADIEAAAAENMLDTRWDAERLRDLARRIAGLPEEVASQALWLAASAPPRVDAINVFASALSSASVRVRCVAVSVLMGIDTDDARRLLLNTLALERDAEVVQTVVKGFAHLPRKRAVRGLMDVMFLPGATGMATDIAAEELRRLTRTEIGNSSVDWRDWWLDNERDYDE